MRVRTCLLVAVLTGALGLGLRSAIQVAPVDEPFRDVLRYYDALELPAR